MIVLCIVLMNDIFFFSFVNHYHLLLLKVSPQHLYSPQIKIRKDGILLIMIPNSTFSDNTLIAYNWPWYAWTGKFMNRQLSRKITVCVCICT